MRIAIVELYLGESGKQGYYNNQSVGIAREFSEIGHSVFIFRPTLDCTDKDTLIEDNIKVINCQVTKRIGVHTKYDWRILEKYNIDVAHINADNQIFIPDLYRYCKRNHIISYFYIGTLYSDSKSFIKKNIMNILMLRNIAVYKKCKCFGKSKSVYEELIKIRAFEPEIAPVGLDINEIPNIVYDIEEERKNEGYSAKDTIVLFVGRMDDYKRPLDFLKLEKILSSYGVKAIMIGTGSLDEKVEQFIIDNSLEEYVKRIKKIPNEFIHKYYCIADYFINLNEHEIFGMSILEAMYQGCTVIAKHAPGPDQIIEKGISGYLVGDTNEIEEIIVSGSKLSKDSIKNRVVSEFSWKKAATEIDSWIRYVLIQNGIHKEGSDG